MVITPSTYKYQSIWSQATNIQFLIFFLLVRKWNKDTDTIAYKICLKKHFFFFWCVLVMTALKIKTIFKLFQKHFFSEPKYSYRKS